ncbi:hypothetical protein EDD15DRAFT_2260411 [Pisolithus albus]|nr:hypothetical protein EDD15DRAFT_2260411 [Pisolithus albus]
MHGSGTATDTLLARCRCGDISGPVKSSYRNWRRKAKSLLSSPLNCKACHPVCPGRLFPFHPCEIWTRSAHRQPRNVISRVRRKEIIRVISGVQQEYLVFSGHENSSKRYPLVIITTSWIAWKKLGIRRHGTGAIMKGLDFPVTMLVCRTMPAGTIITNSVNAVSDLSIMMGTQGGLLERPVWLMECAFLQSDCDIMRKLNAYVRDIPDLLVVGKILVTEAEQYASPGSDSSVAPQLRSSDTMTREEWVHNQSADDFHRVVVDGHTWFSLSSVEIHVWTRQAGRSEIEIDRSDGDEYAVGTLYPTVNLGDINRIFQHGLQLIKEDTFRELVATNADQSLLDHMEAWSPSPCALDSTSLRYALVLGAWTTAYSRSCSKP